MEAVSLAASVLTVIGAAIQTAKALNETVKRYKARDKTLGRLQDGLNDLIDILLALEEAADDDTPVLALLKGPIARCALVSHEFEDALNVFVTSSKTGFRNWAKMEFMRGDINEFIDTLAGYKATITIGLGTITMHASRLTQQVVVDYNEMVKDTAYNLEVRLEQIEEKITSLAADPTLLDDSSIDLKDEKTVTLQCLRICERADSYIQSLQKGQPGLQTDAAQPGAEFLLNQFEAQLLTQKTLSENRDSFLETIGRLRERLDTVTSNRGPDRESEMLRLQEEISSSKQCLEVCKEAFNQVSSQKIHVIGEVIAGEDCDQMVVTALADLFNIGKVKASKRSMQLVGSMPADTLRGISKDRYHSRFGAPGGPLAAAQWDNVAEAPVIFETRKAEAPGGKTSSATEGENAARPEATYSKPSSNEVKKRRNGGDEGAKKNRHE